MSFRALLPPFVLVIGWFCLEVYLVGQFEFAASVDAVSGIRYRDTFSGERIVLAVYVENKGSQTHTGATVEIDIRFLNGDLLKQSRMIGTLEHGKRWSMEFPHPLEGVTTVDVRYQTDDGFDCGRVQVSDAPDL